MKSLAKMQAKPGIWMNEISVPEIGYNDVLIKVKKTAICGTDIHIYNWDEWAQKTIPVGMTVGHEFVGTIVDTGDGVKALSPGQRVSAEGHIVCGYCRNCRAGKRHLCPKTIGIGVNRQGAFAEYISVPASNVYPVPDDISDNLAAIFDPFGNAVHTALSFDLIGEDVLVTGAGPIGIMAALVAQKAGARHVVITDINEYRLNLAKQQGVKHAVNVLNTSPEEVMKSLNMLEGFDIGLEMSGSGAAFNQMLSSMSNGSKIALLGIPEANTVIDWNQVIFKGLIIKGVYGREIFETWYKMTSVIQSGLNLDGIITHHFHVDDYKEAFEVMAGGQSGKVILEWS
ncbi:MAG: L-threonine 3-dehydrogenase [Endozoicomonadaceae bacterium]|nr:L-threonine 3-dehydrogenase [Endozoicomonadaceae bacterium]MCY4328797.1 L-threonine 3-dehydrogenase [Endozoicomonadaceae bacterium]